MPSQPIGDAARDLAKQIDEEPVMRRWVDATQRRNLESLQNAQGPAGEKLAPNAAYTVKRKGHDRVGFGKDLEMSTGLTASDAVNLKVGGPVAEATVFGGPGSTDKKLNMFIRGKDPERRWKSEKTSSGKRRAWHYDGPPVPGRDFIGIDERDVNAAGDDALNTMLKNWGFE